MIGALQVQQAEWPIAKFTYSKLTSLFRTTNSRIATRSVGGVAWCWWVLLGVAWCCLVLLVVDCRLVRAGACCPLLKVGCRLYA